MEHDGEEALMMMVNFEIEAAEALAELARVCSSQPSQDPEMDIQHTCIYTSNTINDAGKCTLCSAPDKAAGYQKSNLASKLSQNSVKDQAIGAQQCSANTFDTLPEKHEDVIPTIPSQSCRAGNKSKPVRRSKRNMSEAEKEAQKLRRVLANRESAKQTIRRRQTMYLELSRQAADLSEENVNLKKEKEIALKHYNSLKGRNKILKRRVSKIKDSKRQETQKKSNSSQTETRCSAPMFYHNQHPLIPCFWPSSLPSSDTFQYHCASHPDAMSSPQFLMPNRCQGQENAGTPFFVLPVPWLLPFQTHGTTSNTNHNRKDETPPTQQISTCSSIDSLLHEDNLRLSLDLNVEPEVSNSLRSMPMTNVYGAASQFTSPPVTLGRHGNFQANDANAVSTSTERMMWSKKNRVKKPEDSFAATEARRKRKEVMKLKNVHCAHDSPGY